MNEFKVGDYVIINKSIVDIVNTKGVVVELMYRSSLQWKEDKLYYYRVAYTKLSKEGNFRTTCNIFLDTSGESIELDVEYARDLKLKELGI
jgi:hypothetical protein